ncbi:MAG: DUF4422 domain-containing protein [Rhodopirellula sp.]|nr:DUF4422 domain-containing protein [Rhodopirellula sp.]
MRIKIYVAHHKPYYQYCDDIFQPIQVGKAIHSIDLGILSDDTGDNISRKNRWYSELTAHYWAWKNVTELDYVGFCHYRRYFSVDRISFLTQACRHMKYYTKSFLVRAFLLSTRYHLWPTVDLRYETLPRSLRAFKDWLASNIDRNTVVVVRPVRFSAETARLNLLKSPPTTLFDLNCVGDILKANDDSSLQREFTAVLNGNCFSAANMFIAPWWYFAEYAAWLFNVLAEHETRCLCSECNRSDRVSGYLGEILQEVFLRKAVREGLVRRKCVNLGRV